MQHVTRVEMINRVQRWATVSLLKYSPFLSEHKHLINRLSSKHKFVPFSLKSILILSSRLQLNTQSLIFLCFVNKNSPCTFYRLISATVSAYLICLSSVSLIYVVYSNQVWSCRVTFSTLLSRPSAPDPNTLRQSHPISHIWPAHQNRPILLLWSDRQCAAFFLLNSKFFDSYLGWGFFLWDPVSFRIGRVMGGLFTGGSVRLYVGRIIPGEHVGRFSETS